MAASYLDCFIHAANILLLAACSVRDNLWLRVLAMASSLAAMPYFLLQPTPLWAAFGWSVLFTGINIFQTWRLGVVRRPVKLTAEEEEVRRLVFRDLPPKKTLQVIGVGTWRSASPGEQLIERGKPLESIALIVRGKVQVTYNGRLLNELGPGAIVGSALLLSGARSEVDAVSTEVTRIIRWNAATLERYLGANPKTRKLFQRRLARNLAVKLERLGGEFTGSGG
jgi:Cyclic nucleotide-binding domain